VLAVQAELVHFVHRRRVHVRRQLHREELGDAGDKLARLRRLGHERMGEEPPRLAAVVRFVRATGADAQVEVLGVARIDFERMKAGVATAGA
jgi:hypothetical protein